jgi:dTDP-4-dehydrorhamnose 3,5-epimerase-like enzyme
MNNNDCRIIDLPKVEDRRGNLTFIEEEKHIPFLIKRAYWIYDVPGGQVRGGHAFKEQCEFIIALSGSFDVVVNDGNEKRIFPLNRSYYGLYINNGLWRHMENFSTNSIALVLSSTYYNEKDYIRNFEEYQEWLKGIKK